jgi:hypothetical protein
LTIAEWKPFDSTVIARLLIIEDGKRSNRQSTIDNRQSLDRLHEASDSCHETLTVYGHVLSRGFVRG